MLTDPTLCLSDATVELNIMFALSVLAVKNLTAPIVFAFRQKLPSPYPAAAGVML